MLKISFVKMRLCIVLIGMIGVASTVPTYSSGGGIPIGGGGGFGMNSFLDKFNQRNKQRCDRHVRKLNKFEL